MCKCYIHYGNIKRQNYKKSCINIKCKSCNSNYYYYNERNISNCCDAPGCYSSINYINLSHGLCACNKEHCDTIDKICELDNVYWR